MFFTAFPSGSLIHHYIFHKCFIFRQISGWDDLHWRPPSPKSGGGACPPVPPPWFTPLRRFNEKLEPCVHIPCRLCLSWQFSLIDMMQLSCSSSMVYQHHFCTYDRGEKSTTGGPTRLTNKQFDVLWTVKRTGCAGEQIKFMELTPLSASADVTGIVWMQR